VSQQPPLYEAARALASHLSLCRGAQPARSSPGMPHPTQVHRFIFQETFIWQMTLIHNHTALILQSYTVLYFQKHSVVWSSAFKGKVPRNGSKLRFAYSFLIFKISHLIATIVQIGGLSMQNRSL
jgi:hypothetical protein